MYLDDFLTGESQLTLLHNAVSVHFGNDPVSSGSNVHCNMNNDFTMADDQKPRTPGGG